MNKKNKRVKKEKNLSLTTTKKTYEIDKPFQMVQMAIILKNHIIKNKLYASIAGKNYVMVEGWQFAGGLMGILPRIVEVKEIAPNKWMAKAEIINQKTKEIIGTGFALCSKEEAKKKTFDEYAILSMAQTRAIGKAYRNLIGWVMKLAGYESTPAEEMVKVKQEMVTQSLTEEVTVQIGIGPKVAELKKMLKGTTNEEKITDLKKKTGLILKDFRITESHAIRLIGELLNHTVKQ